MLVPGLLEVDPLQGAGGVGGWQGTLVRPLPDPANGDPAVSGLSENSVSHVWIPEPILPTFCRSAYQVSQPASPAILVFVLNKL